MESPENYSDEKRQTIAIWEAAGYVWDEEAGAYEEDARPVSLTKATDIDGW